MKGLAIVSIFQSLVAGIANTISSWIEKKIVIEIPH